MRLTVPMVIGMTAAFAQQINVMPLPASITHGSGALAVDQAFAVGFDGYKEARLDAAVQRFLLRLEKATGMPLQPGAKPMLTIHCGGASKPVQALGEDESYKLTVDSTQARLDAPNPLGVLRGLETFLQLVEPGPQGFTVPAVTIEDTPRYPWRGLHIDVSRHWMPLPVILRQLDAMAAVKLNVFHWHLTDDQGFRIESKRFPKLQGMGSDGNYYTQDQVKELIAYARDRGIRVVPEFDIPGHVTSWVVGYPELASMPGPYAIERRWGVFDPTMDPTRESTYKFLDAFIGEMARLFPDEYFHIGGDEVNGKQWNQSEHIVAFKKAHGMKNNDELQAYFNKRVLEIVQKHGKRMEGWDEILKPDLPKDILIQSWRGQKSLAEGARMGFQGILSSPYYLDHMDPLSQPYLADPLGGDAASLNDEEKARILGGEVCSWDEYVTPEIIDGRLWPRTAAIAERFWSPAAVTDVADMYRRLDLLDRRLMWMGNEENPHYNEMLARLAGPGPIGPVATLASALRPVGLGGRERSRHYTQQTPLNRMVDTVLPESRAARELSDAIAKREWASVRDRLVMWRENDVRVKPILSANFLLTEMIPISENVSKVAGIGLEALGYIEKSQAAPAEWVQAQREFMGGLTKVRRPPAEVYIAIAPAVQALVEQAAGSR